jgi:hypothetical protein
MLMVRFSYALLLLIISSTAASGCRKKETEPELQKREGNATPAAPFFEIGKQYYRNTLDDGGFRKSANKRDCPPPYFVVEMRPTASGQDLRFLFLEIAHSTTRIEEAGTVVFVLGGTTRVNATVQKDKAQYQKVVGENREEFKALLLNPKQPKQMRFLSYLAETSQEPSWQKLLEQKLEGLQ